MTSEEAIKWLQEEKFSLERAPDLNGCPMTEDWKKGIDVYDMAISALRAQQEQERNDPLTLDELRQMDGDPVWVRFIGGAIIRENGWFVIAEIGTSEILIKGKVSVYKNLWYYGETWLAYRRKPEEGTE